MTAKKLKAEIRKVVGRKVKNLRSSGILPANVYGKKIASLAVQVDLKDFQKIYSEVGETGLIDLELEKETLPVLVHNVQLNPVTDTPIHVDFLKVNLKEKVEAEVPVEIEGESPAEKQGLGTIVQYINEILVEALPKDLPEKFIVDVSNLIDVDQAIFVKDIKIDTDKIQVKGNLEDIVVKVEPPQKVEEVVEQASTEAKEATVNEENSTGESSSDSQNSDSSKGEVKE